MKFVLAFALGIVLSPFLAIAADPSAPTPPERQEQTAYLIDEWRTNFENFLNQENLTTEQEQIVGQALNMSSADIFEVDSLTKYQRSTGQTVQVLMDELRLNFSQDQYITLMQGMPDTQKFLMSVDIQFDPVCDCPGITSCPPGKWCLRMTCLRPVGSELNGVCVD